MQAGNLRHRVTVQQNAGTQNSRGEKTANWQTFATAWASVEDLDGREFLDAKQVQSEVTTRIRMRYQSGIKPQMRAVWGAHTYEIEAILNPKGRNRELVLMCKELVK